MANRDAVAYVPHEYSRHCGIPDLLDALQRAGAGHLPLIGPPDQDLHPTGSAKSLCAVQYALEPVYLWISQ